MNDSQDWTEWLTQHGDKLLLYARRWAADQATAEDLVQEAFIRFWKSQSQAADPLAYLYQCVRAVAIDVARSNQAREVREANAFASPPLFQPATHLEQQERQQQIESAIADLPGEQAEVVTLKIWSGLTFAQIAAVTGLSANTVASRYRYALAALRNALEESNTP